VYLLCIPASAVAYVRVARVPGSVALLVNLEMRMPRDRVCTMIKPNKILFGGLRLEVKCESYDSSERRITHAKTCELSIRRSMAAEDNKAIRIGIIADHDSVATLILTDDDIRHLAEFVGLVLTRPTNDE
jgi:hypothetical protein